MCGIIGYVGNRDIESVLVVGLEKLSYRGYDSSGIAVIENSKELSLWKKQGKLAELRKELDPLQIRGNIGIAHTRWATHGSPTDANAHPHFSKNSGTAIVHNGIVENHSELKKKLQQAGYVFSSETDSECIVHLIDFYLSEIASQEPERFFTAFCKASRDLEGAYAIAAISESDSSRLLVVRNGSPLLVGVGKDEHCVASDLHSLIHLSQYYYELEENEIAQITEKEVCFFTDTGKRIEKNPMQFVAEDAQVLEGKAGYEHYMLKEIHQQSDVVSGIISQYVLDDKIEQNVEAKSSDAGLIKLGDFDEKTVLGGVERFLFQACGTSYHSALMAKYWIEEMARMQVEVDISSEFRYRHPFTKPSDLVVALSQSGETADTLACIREAKSCYLRVLSFVNVRGSSMHKESDGVIFTRAGMEIGVASTKNYVAQLASLYLFAVHLGMKRKNLSFEQANEKIAELKKVPDYIGQAIKSEKQIEKIAERFAKSKAFLFIGRGLNYPTALEGALKLKEISYIHATGYAAGELKHGPIALIDKDLPVVCLAPNSPTYAKMLSNIQEVKSRQGKIIAIATKGDERMASLADELIEIPSMPAELLPLVAVVPLQLLSYYVALKLGTDVDQPKNLAKSVTVE